MKTLMAARLGSIEQQRETKKEGRVTCRCPLRPYYSLGSFGSGSASETALLRRWEAEHGTHGYAKARDEVARSLQTAGLDLEDAEHMVRQICGAAE